MPTEPLRGGRRRHERRVWPGAGPFRRLRSARLGLRARASGYSHPGGRRTEGGLARHVGPSPQAAHDDCLRVNSARGACAHLRAVLGAAVTSSRATFSRPLEPRQARQSRSLPSQPERPKPGRDEPVRAKPTAKNVFARLYNAGAFARGCEGAGRLDQYRPRDREDGPHAGRCDAPGSDLSLGR
jgi:hypothetical protein